MQASAQMNVITRQSEAEHDVLSKVIVVEHDPFENIRTLQDVLFVMSNGRVAVNRLQFGKT